MTSQSQQGKVVIRDEIEPVHWIGEHGRFLLREEDTGGLFSFFEVTTSPDGGPPLHMHGDHDEALYVVDGTYEVRVDDRELEAPPGTLVYSPRGVPHRFRNITTTPNRLFIIATPGGHERFFEDLSKVLSAGPPDPARLADVATRHHITGLEPMRVPRPAGLGVPPSAGNGTR